MQVTTNIRYGKRTIGDGKKYDFLFDISRLEREDVLKYAGGDFVANTAKIMEQTAKKYKKDTLELAKFLAKKKF